MCKKYGMVRAKSMVRAKIPRKTHSIRPDLDWASGVSV